MALRVFLDSCVILSRLPRELMIEMARNGWISLFFSQSVEDECLHVAHRKGLEKDISAAFVDLALWGQKTESALDDAGLWLPDENDRHVVLGALGAGAEVIASENLRDFPKAALEPMGLVAQSPDQILTPLAAKNSLNINDFDRKALKRAKLYRLAKLKPND